MLYQAGSNPNDCHGNRRPEILKMEAVGDALASLKQAEPWVLVSLGTVLLALTVRILWPTTSPDRPPMLGDTIPYVTNTFQYMGNMNKFMSRAT